MKLRVYLDTSVLSAYYDERVPDRRAQTIDFWARRAGFELATSGLTREELERTPDLVQRRKLTSLLEDFVVHPVTAEMHSLAAKYGAAGMFEEAFYNDAVHVAAAVLTRQDILLSWNFRHLVNRRSRAQVNEFNIRSGLPRIEITVPPEL